MTEKKVAIITGAGGSIGSKTAIVLSGLGFSCALIDVRKANAEATIQQLKNHNNHMIICADVSSAADVDNVTNRVIEEWGRIDVLVNLAASNRKSFNVDDNIEDRWDKTIQSDLKSVFLMSERVVVEMRLNGGTIVNMGSIAGGILGSHTLPYAAAKAGIIGVTKSHARIYGKYNIRVNCIIPGVIHSPMVSDSVAEKEDSYFTAIKDVTPLRRWGEPEEISELIGFLASGKCNFLTGTSIVVDGGATLTLGPRLDESAPFKWEKWPPDLLTESQS